MKRKARRTKKHSKLAKCLNFVKQTTKGALTVFLCIAAILLTGLAGDMVHSKYIEHYIGQNSLYIQSMPDSKEQGSGTAFQVVAPSGKKYILSNAHVCELRNDKDMVMIYDKKNSHRLMPRRVIEVYQKHDLCLIEALPGYPGLEIADSLSIGEPIIAIGYPLGDAMNISRGRVKDFSFINLLAYKPLEECTGENESVQKIPFFIFYIDACVVTYSSVQTDLVIFGGNSGSPVVNMFGNVVAVIFAGNTRTNWGSAVPLDHVKEFLKGY